MPNEFNAAPNEEPHMSISSDTNPELVSFPGLGMLAGAATRANIRGFTTRARIRAKLRHPLLLQRTPKEYLGDETIDMNLHQPDSPIVSSAPPQQNSKKESYDPQPTLTIHPGPWRSCSCSSNTDSDYIITPVSYDLPPINYNQRSLEGNQFSRNAYLEDHRSAEATHGLHFYHHGFPHKFPNQPQVHDGFHSHSHTEQGGFHFGHPPGNQITVNKQQTTLVLPPSNSQNFQISQISGNHNSVSQSQGTSHHSPPFSSAHHHNAQTSQIFGSHNAVSQSQSQSHFSPLIRMPQPFISQMMNDDMNRRSKRSTNDDDEFLKKEEKIFNKITNLAQIDNDLRFITKMEEDILDDFENNFNSITGERAKRNIPLLRLVVDPNAKIDVPRTFENIGTVTRSSLEDERAPMYHFRNAVGSAKDAFMSTLKIPPQDLIIPSKYKIVNRADLNQNSRGAEAEDLQASTFGRVGSMLRESIQSGQEALGHVGDIYHSARKAIATTRNVAPKIITSALRVPEVQQNAPLRLDDGRAVLITPKLLELKQEGIVQARQPDDPDFVGWSQLLDSLGLSNPDAREVDLRRVVLQPLRNSQGRSSLQEKKGKLKDRLKKYYILDDVISTEPTEEIEGTLDALDEAKSAMGVGSLKDFLTKMKGSLKEQVVRVENKTKTNAAKINELANKSELVGVSGLKSARRQRAELVDALDMIVSLASNMTNDLLNNNASSSIESVDDAGELQHFLSRLFTRRKKQSSEMIGAINPSLFKQMWNESLESAERDVELLPLTTTEIIPKQSVDALENKTAPLGIFMEMGDALLKPFMGLGDFEDDQQRYEEWDDDFLGAIDENNTHETFEDNLSNVNNDIEKNDFF